MSTMTCTTNLNNNFAVVVQAEGVIFATLFIRIFTTCYFAAIVEYTFYISFSLYLFKLFVHFWYIS